MEWGTGLSFGKEVGGHITVLGKSGLNKNTTCPKYSGLQFNTSLKAVKQWS